MCKHICIIENSLRIAKTNSMLPTQSHLRPLDIIVSVVDNYGDMGMILEFILSMHQFAPMSFSYHIWTDSPELVHHFLELNTFEGIEYSLSNLRDF
jgi:hypothetical protein